MGKVIANKYEDMSSDHSTHKHSLECWYMFTMAAE